MPNRRKPRRHTKGGSTIGLWLLCSNNKQKNVIETSWFGDTALEVRWAYSQTADGQAMTPWCSHLKSRENPCNLDFRWGAEDQKPGRVPGEKQAAWLIDAFVCMRTSACKHVGYVCVQRSWPWDMNVLLVNVLDCFAGFTWYDVPLLAISVSCKTMCHEHAKWAPNKTAAWILQKNLLFLCFSTERQEQSYTW